MTELQKRALTEWLDDLCVRFIINLPQEELESVERICFQVEEAQWFYEDFIRPLDPTLPSMNLKKFCMVIFQHCPLLSEFSQYHHFAAFSEFLAYKQRVPVRGAIMLNEAMDEVVLVKGWKKGARWSFPRGKINKDESDLDCAMREVYEETGYDIKVAGLADDPDRVHAIEVSMREQHMKLFVFRGVPMDTYFEPRTRKEISKIDWYKLSDLPTLKQMRAHHHSEAETQAQHQSGKFYMVAPFLGPLKQWIRSQKKKDKLGISAATVAAMPTEDNAVADHAIADVEKVMARSQATDHSDGHFNSLLAGLRASTHPADLQQPPQPSVSDPADAAAALKRMLSVGQAATPQTQPTPLQAAPTNPLLDILRGTRTTSASGQQGPQQLPATPFEQIINTPPPPQTPPRNPNPQTHRVLPSGLGAQPPQFPIPAQEEWQQQRQQQQQSYQPQLAPQQATINLQQQAQPLPQLQPQRSEHASQLLNLFRSNAREDSVHLKQPPPSFVSPAPGQAAVEPQQSSLVPQASKLPVPKLNAHAMSLLDAFKSPAARSAAPVQHLQHYVSELSASDTSPTMPAARPYQMANQGSAKAQSSSTPQQQSTLLNLFNAPSNNARQPSLQPQVAELAAQTTPHPPTRQLPPEYSKPHLGLQTEGVSHAPGSVLTSATITGPLHSPDLGTLKRSQPPPVELGENTPVVPPHTQRPAMDEALPHWPTPPVPSGQALSPASNAPELTSHIEAPQPVSYQILQRPAVLKTPIQTGPTPGPSHFDSRENVPIDQKSALLSLLTGSAGQGHGHGHSLKPSTSSIMSPVSPLPGSMKSLQGSPAGGDGKSRVSSIASLPGNVVGVGSATAGQPPLSMIMTDHGIPKPSLDKQHSQMMAAQVQGQQSAAASMMGKSNKIGTPNSPVDKSVLLGFLQNVAKTG